MSNPTETLQKAIDEALEPLINDHRTYLASGTDQSMPVSRADLHYVFDQYRTQLLDFSADVMPIGHKHPFVHDAIKEHMNYYMRTAPVGDHVLRWPVEYARDLVATLTPEDDEPTQQVLFTEGEREAVQVALSIARQTSGRDEIAIVDTGVHDWVSLYDYTDHALLPTEEFWLSDFKWDQVGALLMSLVCEDGRVLDPKWVQSVAEITTARGVSLIIDESRTGFGRLGTMWGQQSFQVDPDITVLGGPAGGGLALGAVIAPAEQFKRVSWDLSPQAGSPVACAAGAGTLRGINDGVLSHVTITGPVLDTNLTQLVEQFSEYLKHTSGRGFYRFLEFRNPGFAHQFVYDARFHGLLLAPPVESSVILTPTLIASEPELIRGIDLMADTLLDWMDKDAA